MEDIRCHALPLEGETGELGELACPMEDVEVDANTIKAKADESNEQFFHMEHIEVNCISMEGDHRNGEQSLMVDVEVDAGFVDGRIGENGEPSCPMKDVEVDVLSTEPKIDEKQTCPLKDVEIDAISTEGRADGNGKQSCLVQGVNVGAFYVEEGKTRENFKQSYSTSENPNSNDNSCIPKLGMEFDDEDGAYQFYNLYAQKLGFSVRVHNWKKNKKGVLTRKEFVCYRQGYPRTEKKGGEVRLKPTSRCGCTAKIVLKRGSAGRLCVVEFEPSHNHLFVNQSDVHMLRSHRKMVSPHAAAVASANKSGISPMTTHESLGLQTLLMNCTHYLRSRRTCSPSNGDIGALMQYLASKSASDPYFFSSMQLDEDELITNIFWADGRSRIDYECFGDVVCFDTTFIINNCRRPFTLFIGVNNHKQITIFGAALMYDQSIESFEWLFQTFDKAMKGKKPKVILTDLDPAMAKALANEWPVTYHQLCVWHIYQNASKYLSCIYGKNGFKTDFIKCVFDCDDGDIFLLAWQDMLMKHDLVGNEWLLRLFDIKEKWALAYARDRFSADILTIQRSEIMYNVLKKHLNIELNLLSFLEHYDRLVEDRRYAELQQDIRAYQTTPTMLFSFLLREAAKVYTPNIFEKFREEVLMTSDCDVDYLGEEGPISKYKVNMVEGVKEYLVHYETSSKIASCSCRKFEFIGILCCHALKVLDHLKIKGLPEHYILKRWTKEAKSGIVQQFLDSVQCNEKSTAATRYNLIAHTFIKIAARASESQETYQYLASQSMDIMKAVEHMLTCNSNAVDPSLPNLHL